MTTIKRLLKELEEHSAGDMAAREFAVRLPVKDAARLAALAEMYPRKSETQLVTELLSAALDELEASFPYLEGPRVVAEDEFGDPIYEDLGPSRRFADLTRKHSALLSGDATEQEAPHESTG